MQLEKYKELLVQKIKRQILHWNELDETEQIHHNEVILFLHSLQGTAGTIGLTGLQLIVAKLYTQAEEMNAQKVWDRHELLDFLSELISLCYQYEHFDEKELEQAHYSEVDANSTLIQVMDEDVSMLILLKDYLEKLGYMVLGQTDPHQALKSFYELSPDCLIMDVSIIQSKEYDLSKQLEHQLQHTFIPTIMMSMNQSRETRLNTYTLGADAFFEKPIDLEELSVRLTQLIRRKRLFEQSILVDELTQVYNRKFLTDILNRNLAEIRRTGSYFTLAVLDLDFFKQVNDTYGHVFGDHVLATFASFLVNHTRSTDTVFRYGGEEFVIIFPRTKDTEAKVILERIIVKFRENVFCQNGDLVTVSFSAGLFMVLDGKVEDKSIIEVADQALYLAKENGRGRVESANESHLAAKKKTIFVSVVDDDLIIRTMLTKLLSSMEFEQVVMDIAVFENGLSYFQSGRHEIDGQHFLILDGVMPMMDGIEILQKVKSGRFRNLFHVLMLTSRKSEQDISRALRIGADDYVVKPFNLNELESRIYRLIQRITTNAR